MQLVDDFYVYYKISNDNAFGTINAVAPHALPDMEMEHIRISSELGIKFSKGIEALNRWTVVWNNTKQEMVLTQPEIRRVVALSTVLSQISTDDSAPRKDDEWIKAILDWNDGAFRIHIQNIGSFPENLKLVFFVTRYEDPNIIYTHFSVNLHDCLVDEKTIVECELPEKFSVFTLPVLDRYLLRINNLS